MNHKTLRKQVWANAYLRATSHGTGKYSAEFANSALKAFDDRFPKKSKTPKEPVLGKIVPERDTYDAGSEPYKFSK